MIPCPCQPTCIALNFRLVVSLQKRALAEMEQSGLIPLVQQDKLEDLGRMHALFRRVDGGAELMRQVRMCMCASGGVLVPVRVPAVWDFTSD